MAAQYIHYSFSEILNFKSLKDLINKKLLLKILIVSVNFLHDQIFN